MTAIMNDQKNAVIIGDGVPHNHGSRHISSGQTRVQDLKIRRDYQTMPRTGPSEGPRLTADYTVYYIYMI